MKKRNSFVLRRVLSSFSVLVILFSHGTSAFASVGEGTETGDAEASIKLGEAQEETGVVEKGKPPQTMEDQQAGDTETPSVEPPVAEVPPAVDKTILQNKISELTQVLANSSLYTSTSLSITTANQLLARGQQLLASEEVSDEEIANCVAEITNLLAKLVLRGDKGPLQALVATAAGLVETDYTSASYSALAAALVAAQQLLNDPDAVTESLTAALNQLQSAIAGLVKTEAPKPETPKPEKPKPENPETPKPDVPVVETPKETKPEKPVIKEPETDKPASNKSEEEQSVKESDGSQQVVDTGVTDSTDETQSEESTTTVVETNSDDDSTNEIDTNFAVDSLTSSDLNDFELPLLSSFSDQRQAALIVQGLKTLSQPFDKAATLSNERSLPESFSNRSLLQYLYSSVLDVNLGEGYDEMAQVGERVSLDQLQPGDLLFWENQGQPTKVAMYLAEGKYLMADEPLQNQNVVIPSVNKTKTTVEEKDAQEDSLPGVRIYTLQGYSKDENGKVRLASSEEGTLPEKMIESSEQHANPNFAQRVLADQNLTLIGEELLASYGASIDFRKNPVTESFIASIAEDARELGLQYDVYASVMIAQAILETGSGGSLLSKAPYYNLFGIKGLYNGNSVSMKTMEDDGTGNLYQITAAFRNYPNFRASLTDYVSLIRGGTGYNQTFYQGVWRSEAKNYLQATAFLTGRYATDTSYNNKLNSLIATYHLTQYDEPRVADAGVIITRRDAIPNSYAEKMIFPDYNGVDYNHSGSYPVGQCTWYVYNRIAQLGGTVDDFMGNGGEWGQRGASLGYRTTQIPTVGYAVSFHPGVASSSKQYGHVAFVEAVGPEGILVSEGNVVGPTTVSYRVIPNSIARTNQVTYVAPK